MATSVNGKILTDPEEKTLTTAAGLFRGEGLFETLRIRDRRPLRLGAHARRLAASAAALALPAPPEEGQLRDHIDALLAPHPDADGVLRLTWSGRGDLFMTLAPYPYPPETWERGFRVRLSPWQRNPSSPTVGHKTCAYLDNLLIRREAAVAGYDEALLLNPSGELCEGSFTNLFFVSHGKLHTPAPSCGLLPGILRAEVLRLAPRLGLPVVEGRFGPQALQEAQEIFLTNSLLGVVSVFALEDRRIGLPRPITQALASAVEKEETSGF